MKLTENVLINYWKSPIFCHLVFYGMFCLLFFFSHSSIISLVAFFHFLLGHQFNTIGDWTFRYGWEVIAFSKLFALFITLKFLGVRARGPGHFRRFFYQGLVPPQRTIFVVVIFLMANFAWLGRPQWVGDKLPSPFNGFQGISYLGVVVFYLTDYLVFAYLRSFFPLKGKRDYVLYYLLFPFIFYYTAIITIPFIERKDFLVILHLLTCLIFLEFRETGLTYPLIYLLIFVGPLCALFGLDPIWGQTYSMIKMGAKIPVQVSLFLWLTVYGHLVFSARKEWKWKANSIS